MVLDCVQGPFFGLTPPLLFNSEIRGFAGLLEEPLGLRGKEVVCFEMKVAGVRTPNLQHQKRTLYPLHHAPPGCVQGPLSPYNLLLATTLLARIPLAIMIILSS